MDKALIEQKMWHWIDAFIIQENICPFARKERMSNGISLHIFDAHSLAATADIINTQFKLMSDNENLETCIMIAATGLDDFDEYMLHLEEAQYQLDKQGYSGIFQLASFHPYYQFAGEEIDSLSNYSNRSPFPAIHIIREQSITDALASFTHPERIPERNIEHCEKLGKAFFERLLS